MKQWFAVIGDPIAQSLSPCMHDEWLKENGLDASYVPIRVPRGTAADGISSLRLLGCSGWNVTVPHKSDVMPHLDRIDGQAARMGAVNTVIREADGTLTGANTDGSGFVRALEEVYGPNRKNDEILLIGAGGAAKGIAFALEENGYGHMTVTNRTRERAELLSSRLDRSAVLTIEEAEEQLGRFGIVIQTTTVGMSYSEAGVPLCLDSLEPGTAVIDIIYNPLETEFLKRARARGAETTNGVGMFVHQGALAFERWTGIRPDTAGMIRRLTQQLEEDHVNE
ncbi:shikimate dehydrogenase (NADP(+)) [Sporosarcina sp. NCCP-2716]|uniref:shikimate dehydrogenase n=1 Tax=Sporosarcina sp. NCCP-2716 TaxID=2943679 RepID=UPI00203C2377|nr:shikimate dehydrogenase [Sporosarcina sp. NCCP-2716]GKV68016.1 shikimate dehydrogenase (NADP(+)) [Sporosarcina sp. NCCP-2716]